MATLSRQFRSNQTDAERRLWRELRDRRFLGFKFRRQHPVPSYVVDFACIEKKLVVGLDGGQHAVHTEKDADRTRYLEAQGFRVLRFWNNEVLGNIEGVLATLREALAG